MNLRHVIPAHLIPLCFLLPLPLVHGQDRQSLELGSLAQTTSNKVTGPYRVVNGPSSTALLGTNHEQIFVGPFVDYMWAITKNLSVEGRAAYLPGKQPIQSLSGGSAFLASAGIRAITGPRRIRFYDRIAPGFVSFSQAGESVTAAGWQTSRSTYFALDEGGGVEVQVNRHNAIRVDASTILYVEGGHSG